MVRYKIKGTAYILDEETGDTVIVEENGITALHTKNPIEGFNTFWQSAGFKVLKEIKDKLEAHGFDRWTGEKS